VSGAAYKPLKSLAFCSFIERSIQMKRVATLTAVALAVALVTPAFGQIVPGNPGSYPSVSIASTPHNLNTSGVALPGGQICIPCHTPHNALLSGEENVLWNHAETAQSFTMYFAADTTGPRGASKLCLSCHDGVTAIDNYGGNGGTGVTITGSANLGTQLDNDHPIGVEYVAAAGQYNAPPFALGINSGPGVRLVADAGGVDRVECTSCHEPHNNGLGFFLRVPLQESYLCLQCHIK
jgi:predicted CXXCH cytochrome family protein